MWKEKGGGSGKTHTFGGAGTLSIRPHALPALFHRPPHAQRALYLLLAFLSPPNGLFFRELAARLVVTMDMTSLVVQRRLAK